MGGGALEINGVGFDHLSLDHVVKIDAAVHGGLGAHNLHHAVDIVAVGIHVVGYGPLHRIDAGVIGGEPFLGFQQIRRAETALGPEAGSLDVIHAEDFALAQGAAVVIGDGRQEGGPAQ